MQHAIAGDDKEIARLSLMIAAKYCNGGSAEMSNSIGVSSVEHLIYRKLRGHGMRWPRSFEQNFRVAKWIIGPGVKLLCGAAADR